MNLPDLDAATVSSVAALVTASGLAVKQLVEWVRDRRIAEESDDLRRPRIDTAIAQSADAAVIALSKTVDTLQDENGRLATRVLELENALAARDKKIELLEARVRLAEVELRAVADELAILKNHG